MIDTFSPKQADQVEYVVALEITTRNDGTANAWAETDAEAFDKHCEHWEQPSEALLARTELTFSATGYMIKQVMADGLVLSLSMSYFAGVEHGKRGLATLKAEVLKLCDMGINVDPRSLLPDEVVNAMDAIEKLCQPDADAQEQA